MFSVHAPFDAKKALIEKHRARVNPADAQRSPTYAAMIESMDDAIGTLLDTLDRLKLADRTIIVFTSDNGGNMYNEVDCTTPTSNRPLRGGKATVFEGGIRVPGVVVMPGVTQPGARSDTIIQSEDYYPTLLEALALKPAPGQRFDGTSILPALRGQPLAREATFNYFPHEPGVPDWLPPAVVAHSGDWKLIRIFHGGENGAHRHFLFNLRDDLGEKNNLATKEPARVKQLDALIEKFLADTKAVVPIPNPKFDPAKYQPELEGKAESKAKGAKKAGAKGTAPAVPEAKAHSADPLQGWKARGCAAVVKAGVVTVTGQGSAPFLGVGAGLSGPATVRFRARSTGGGEGKVEWLPAANATTEAKSTPFTVAAGGWQEVTVSIPATGPLGIVRLYLPAQKQPVDVDWIELMGGEKTKRWEF